MPWQGATGRRHPSSMTPTTATIPRRRQPPSPRHWPPPPPFLSAPCQGTTGSRRRYGTPTRNNAATRGARRCYGSTGHAAPRVGTCVQRPTGEPH
jgi:hypothetical protein